MRDVRFVVIISRQLLQQSQCKQKLSEPEIASNTNFEPRQDLVTPRVFGEKLSSIQKIYENYKIMY